MKEEIANKKLKNNFNNEKWICIIKNKKFISVKLAYINSH
jgi:hypothetical protein